MANQKETQICKKDGFPILRIHGRQECLAEYIDRCIGQQPVTDVVQKGDTVYYIFENGHALPLLCFCCNGPLAFTDFEYERTEMRGRRLEAMDIGPEELENGNWAVGFNLEFSGKLLKTDPVVRMVSIGVAEGMIHPADCPWGKHRPRPNRSKRRR
jgi:hypothetical protein